MSSGTIFEQGLVQKILYLLRLSFKPLCVSLCLLYLYGILYFVFTPDEGSPEDSKPAWCEEYHPNLTYSACADVAGW